MTVPSQQKYLFSFLKTDKFLQIIINDANIKYENIVSTKKYNVMIQVKQIKDDL